MEALKRRITIARLAFTEVYNTLKALLDPTRGSSRDEISSSLAYFETKAEELAVMTKSYMDLRSEEDDFTEEEIDRELDEVIDYEHKTIDLKRRAVGLLRGTESPLTAAPAAVALPAQPDVRASWNSPSLRSHQHSGNDKDRLPFVSLFEKVNDNSRLKKEDKFLDSFQTMGPESPKYVTLPCPVNHEEVTEGEKIEMKGTTNNEKDATTKEGSLASCCNDAEVLKPDLRVKLRNGNKEIDARLIMDIDSQKSYITKGAVHKMGYESLDEQTMSHSLFGGRRTETVRHKKYRVHLSSIDDQYRYVRSLDILRIRDPVEDKSVYVDNKVASLNTRDQLDQFMPESTAMMKLASFDLRGWENNGDNSSETQTAVLGITWDKEDDAPSSKLPVLNQFRDLGCPTVVLPKLLLSWKQKLNWNEDVKNKIEQKFLLWVNDGVNIERISIPRCFLRDIYYWPSSKMNYSEQVMLEELEKSSIKNDAVKTMVITLANRNLPERP
ncbi:hypothetical protein M0802_011945 [Mischocyttarus mexicanus]|nr:hypothetical protein M0802_011945 [Mischocyttarus mexicanus]